MEPGGGVKSAGLRAGSSSADAAPHFPQFIISARGALG
jgi:hypothetical protein